MKRHLKRLAAPKSWPIKKKIRKFITRALPGAHSLRLGIPLNVILRDVLVLASNNKEVKNILNNKEILINGKRRKEKRFIVGLMDTISIPEINKYYRVILKKDKKGKIILNEINKEESEIKLCKIIGKTKKKKDVTQLNLSDGRNFLVKEDNYKTSDSLLISLPKQEIKDHISLKKNNTIFLIGGKYMGEVGVIENVQKEVIHFKIKNKKLETLKKYAYVIGRDKPLIKI